MTKFTKIAAAFALAASIGSVGAAFARQRNGAAQQPEGRAGRRGDFPPPPSDD